MTQNKQQLLKHLQQKQYESQQQTAELYVKIKPRLQNHKTYQNKELNSVSCLVAVSFPTIIISFYCLLLINICSHANGAVHKSREIDAVETLKIIKKEDDLRYSTTTQSVNPHSMVIKEFSRYTVIRPEIQHGLHKRVIRSTLQSEDGLHAPQIILSYYHDGRRVLIDMKRNDELLPNEHFLRYQNSKAQIGYVVKQNFTKTELALCHYQGCIRGKTGSTVAISTCDGFINGVVFDGQETYFIHSGNDGQLHDEHYLLRQTDMLDRNSTCGYREKDNFLDLHDHNKELENLGESDKNLKGLYKIDVNEFHRIRRHKRSYEDNNMIRGPYNANNHSSYVELVIVVDNKLYKWYGESTKKVHQHCKDLANIINALYVPLNIFVALVGVVIWNESNEIEFSSDGDVTLRNFLNYRRNKLVWEHPNDNAQLLTKETFTGGVVGKALKGPICTHVYSGGVSMEHSSTIAVVATTMAHEMGHNFGMEHDSPDCKCQDEKCIMSASSTSVVPEHWSSCSIDQLNIAFSRGMNYCLRNKPTKLFESPQCGNGFVEAGEQCDCGLPKYCENSCCDAHTCMLHANASCATGECCDLRTCRPKSAGMECRGADNECDLPEYCTGESEYCPTDVFKRDTESCDSNRAYCYQGSCRSHNNQCRILWGPTGESSEHCYHKNVEGKRSGNCGMNRINSTYIPCEPLNVACGLLHCHHLNERLEFGMESAAELSNSFINHEGTIMPCRTALVDLGLQSIDPGLAPNGAKCDTDKMCVNQKCVSVAILRAEGMGKACPNMCSGNGVCNSRGNCHCDIGFSGEDCRLPGHGGSPDSGPLTNPNSPAAFQKFMYIFLFAVVPFMVGLCFFMYYCRNHPYFVGGKFTENIIKSATGNKQSATRIQNTMPQSAPGVVNCTLPKSSPSSTDDMNSALLKSPTDSGDASMGNGMFGKFKGFTLRPLNDNTSPVNNLNASNVAYVQPTVQQDHVLNGPQRSAPAPPIIRSELGPEKDILNGTLPRPAPPPPAHMDNKPALPPPNPGSQARPIISKPVLENCAMSIEEVDLGSHRSAPPPPVPLHTDPKLNVKRDGTIRRIASFLKKDKDEWNPPKEKMYIDRDKLRQLEISAPIPVIIAQTESSNSDSENTTSPKEDETKNLVKRAQSMRSPNKKPNIQTFGSMRQSSQGGRPKSSAVTSNTSAVRPKSPPPRPPPLLKKSNSTTSSGYQMPIGFAKKTKDNTYDDCEFVELPITHSKKTNSTTSSGYQMPIGFVKKSKDDGYDDIEFVEIPLTADDTSQRTSDNIYSVIEEIPPAAKTLKRSELLPSTSCDMGLLSEIVHEIEKRNGDSIYSASTLNATSPVIPTTKSITTTSTLAKTSNQTGIPAETAISTATTTSTVGVSSYLRPAPLNTPVARVAPTRSDVSPTNAFSSFKPQNSIAITATTTTSTNMGNKPIGAGIVNRNKSFNTGSATLTSTTISKTLPVTGPSATIQKPKPLSAKPSFNNSTRKTVTATGVGSGRCAIGTPRAAPTVKTGNITNLTQRFEKETTHASTPSGDGRK